MANQQKRSSTVSQVASVVNLPGYKIKDVLGKGGMAVVYLAVQESVGREVALKILAPDHTDDDFSERFLREARIISNLSHPNIITVYDAGIHQGCHYMSMEYVPGNSLRGARDKLNRKQKIGIIKQVAKALDYAGNKGYVHRDIKPENILLHEDGRAILTDFGIARNQNAAKGLTVTGKVIGTPYYMSPEQTKGVTVDHRSDIYSLGIVLFQALAGYLPFDGPSLVAIGIKHLSEPAPKLPSGLEIFQPIVDKCMEKSPDKRYQTAEELYQALNEISDAELDYLDARAAATKKLGKDYTASTMVDNGSVTLAPDQIKRSQQKKQTVDKPDTLSFTTEDEFDAFADEYITETDEFKRLNRRKRWLWLVLLAVVAGAGYYKQTELLQAWNQHAKPEVESYIRQLFDQGVPSENNSNTQSAKVKPETKTPVRPDNKSVNTETATIKAQALSGNIEKSLNEQPEKVVELTRSLRQRLTTNPNDQDAIQGLKQIAHWYVGQTRQALDNSELKKARTTVMQAKHGIPKELVPTQLVALENQLIQFETINNHLAKAELYMQQGAIVVPVGKNALDELKAVIAVDPKHQKAIVMINKIANDLYQSAQQKFKTAKLQEALSYSEYGLSAKPDHKELRVLKQNIQQEILVQNRILTLLARARAQFQAGKIIEPDGQSAVDLYKRVLQLKPNNPQALDGMRKSEDYVVKQINTTIWQKRFKLSEKILFKSVEHFPNSRALEQAARKLKVTINKNAPRVTHILISEHSIGSMLKEQEAIKTSPAIYIGFSYTNLAKDTTLLDFKLDAVTEKLNLVNKKLIVTEKHGEHIFSVKHPLATFLPGKYRLSISLQGKNLLVHNFTIQNADSATTVKVR